MGRKNYSRGTKVLDLDIEPEVFEKMRNYEVIRLNYEGSCLCFRNDDANRGRYKSYPKLKVIAKDKGYTLSELAKNVHVEYQRFVNACNGRTLFPEDWKPIIAECLDEPIENIF